MGRFNNCFKEQFKQYITKYKEGDKNLKIKINNAFKSLILDIESELNLEESANKKELKLGTIYLIVFRKLMPNKITFISTVLANKAFSYLLILKDITKPILTTNPFIYTLNTPSSQYTLDVFLGIVVNIRASRKSIASYSQF